MLQQCLPLAVLKLVNFGIKFLCLFTVATVLTACGIETDHNEVIFFEIYFELQQCLPLAVLKRYGLSVPVHLLPRPSCNSAYRLRYWNLNNLTNLWFLVSVATVLTACGIETKFNAKSKTRFVCCNSAYRLRYWNDKGDDWSSKSPKLVATVLTACGIETCTTSQCTPNTSSSGCNSAYRLRYWNWR